MRIFKDLDLVEQLGSGIPRILQAYPQDSFHFSENFLRLKLLSSESVTRTEQDTMPVRELVKVFTGVHAREELQKILGKNTYSQLLKKVLVVLTIPDKPTSRNQKYYLTEKGKQHTKA